MKWILAILTTSLIGVGSLLYFTGFTESYMEAYEGHPNLPSCDWPDAVDGALRAAKNIQILKLAGLTVISLNDPKPVSITREKVSCTAKIRLSNSAKATIDYNFSIDLDVGRVMIVSEIKEVRG